jgi:hypothetical protein
MTLYFLMQTLLWRCSRTWIHHFMKWRTIREWPVFMSLLTFLVLSRVDMHCAQSPLRTCSTVVCLMQHFFFYLFIYIISVNKLTPARTSQCKLFNRLIKHWFLSFFFWSMLNCLHYFKSQKVWFDLSCEFFAGFSAAKGDGDQSRSKKGTEDWNYFAILDSLTIKLIIIIFHWWCSLVLVVLKSSKYKQQPHCSCNKILSKCRW